MNTLNLLMALFAVLALDAGRSRARADTADATCHVREDGDTISLSPGNQANHFKAQHGNKVVRSEFSQANSEVIVDAVGVRGGSATERWRCLVSNDGTVQDPSVVSR